MLSDHSSCPFPEFIANDYLCFNEICHLKPYKNTSIKMVLEVFVFIEITGLK